MLALALTAAGLEPSFIVGGDLNDIGSGAVWELTRGELFVVEADESDGTFLKVGAATALVTNELITLTTSGTTTLWSRRSQNFSMQLTVRELFVLTIQGGWTRHQ